MNYYYSFFIICNVYFSIYYCPFILICFLAT